jgi:hypothetical protein
MNDLPSKKKKMNPNPVQMRPGSKKKLGRTVRTGLSLLRRGLHNRRHAAPRRRAGRRWPSPSDRPPRPAATALPPAAASDLFSLFFSFCWFPITVIYLSHVMSASTAAAAEIPLLRSEHTDSTIANITHADSGPTLASQHLFMYVFHHGASLAG